MASERKAEHLGETAPTRGRDHQRAAVAHALEPAHVEAAPGERRADRAREVRPPLGPIEARPAEGALPLPHRREVDAEPAEEIDAGGGDLAAVIAEHDMAALDQGVSEADAEAPGEMVVAGARVAQRGVELAGRAVARRPVGGDRHDALDHAADRRRRQPVVAVTPLLLRHEQPRLGQLGEVAAGGLRRDTRGIGELARGERPPVHQGTEHVGASRIAEQRRDFGDLYAFPHGPHPSARPPPELTPTLRRRPKRFAGTADAAAPTFPAPAKETRREKSMSIAKASTAPSWTARHTSSLVLASMCLGVL